MPATENRLRLSNRAGSFSVEKGNFEGDFAVENGRKFESEESTVLIQELHSEENTVRIHDQRI